MEAKLMHVFAELLSEKNSRDCEDPESGSEAAAAQRLAIESVLAGCSEVSASQEEDPLGWLVGLAEQGIISQEEALLAANSELIGETLLNKGNDDREAMTRLLEWSDEYRRTFIRIYADDPAHVNYTSKESAIGVSMGKLDGYSLLHGPLSQSSSRVAELCRAYLDAAESGHTIHGPDGEQAPLLIPGSRPSDTYKAFNQASGLPGLCEHLSRRIIGLLETEYEGLFESLNGLPLTIALIEQNNVVGIGSLQDMQLEALLRAALRSVQQGGEPQLEIVVRNPVDVNQFRATRDWIDGVAEQTLCGRLRCIPYQVGVLLTVDASSKLNVSQTWNGQVKQFHESGSANLLPEVKAEQIKQAAQAADMARFADAVILEATRFPSYDVDADLSDLSVGGHEGTSDTIERMTQAIRGVKPKLPVWAAFDEVHTLLDGAGIWASRLTGIICPETGAIAARLAAARYALLQGLEGEYGPNTSHNQVQHFPL
ncbi:PEP-utilizing protein [Paenibacillus maysiensis]|uniref:PEP-utilizing protein n=1 Tax=Paenibacillus maysiensis TaxID=1155954 RepID=UPI00046FF14B|nr:PEP-utilizing protein [Paenibacillus maysiensis]